MWGGGENFIAKGQGRCKKEVQQSLGMGRRAAKEKDYFEAQKQVGKMSRGKPTVGFMSI